MDIYGSNLPMINFFRFSPFLQKYFLLNGELAKIFVPIDLVQKKKKKKY